MIAIQKIKELIKNKENLNEFIFVWYIFSFFIFLPISKFSIEIYRIVFIINTAVIFIMSYIKTGKILLKKDIILLFIVIGIFIIDFFFRKNEYTIQIYYEFIKRCYIPCYFFNRTTSIKSIMKYLSNISKIIILFYIWDPLLNYYFTGIYMGYGMSIMLPAFISIYTYCFIKKDKWDIIFLIFSFLAIFIFGNRTCLLAILFMIALSSPLLLRDFKRIIYNIRKKQHKKTNKYCVILSCFIIVVVFAYFCPAPENTCIANFKKWINNISTGNGSFLKSYSLGKYEQMMEGNYSNLISKRTIIYPKAIELIKNDFYNNLDKLILGNGTGYFMSINEGVYSHSILFDLIIEYGIIGIGLFGSIFIYCLIKWIKKAKKENFLFGIFLLCLAFPKLLLSSYFQKETYLWLFLIWVISQYANNNLKRLEP